MKPRVYVETSVLSYLTARPSRDLVRRAHQQITIEWWSEREAYELFVSDAVLAEAGRRDSIAAAERMSSASSLEILAATQEAEGLAGALLASAVMPANAAIDAAHVAIATVHGMDFLLTWNCRHIANAMMLPRIDAVCRGRGFAPPVICTPEQLRSEVES